ncbi:MAG: heme biosynthesis HemY N-terminal domain-containing protein [Burkholderiaceae bacterium]
MRAALWFLAIFAAAVGIALFASNSKGMVTLFWPPHRVDMSLNLVLLLLIAAFVLLHFALRALSALLDLPTQAKAWRSAQRERAMHTELQAAMAHLLAGRFSRARKLAIESAQHAGALSDRVVHSAQAKAMAHLVAAEAAQALQDLPLRDTQLQAALAQILPKNASAVHEGAQLRAARWALSERDPAAALKYLAQLPQGAQRRTLALRLKLRAARFAKQSSVALDTARLLAKHGAFSPVAANSLLRSLAIDTLTDAHDGAQLLRAWDSLSDTERAQSEVATHAALRLVNVSAGTPDASAQQQRARQWLQSAWDSYPSLTDSAQSRLVQALEATFDTLDTTWLGKIEAAQRQLPRDGRLQYLAGMACMKRELWGKAQQLLSLATEDLNDEVLKRGAWRALALLAQNRGDTSAASIAWRRAAGG